MTAPVSTNAYDQVRYPGQFYPQSSPERLATLATLYGLEPAAVAQCRVLELGCGDGGNLIPLAYYFPHSRFLGVDLSASALERGQALSLRLGLHNIELRRLDITTLSADVGSFDYIISHGVLSWVAEPVRVRMFEIVRDHLAPEGIAYLSYNTLPGGYLRAYARDIMRLHSRQVDDPVQKTSQARAAIALLLEAMPTEKPEREIIRRAMAPYQDRDFFLFHDLLAEVHDPVYFLDFMQAAGDHGLQFLCEANPGSARTAHLPAAVRIQLEALPDRLLREQYLDFIHSKRFRQTLLCRAGHRVDLEVTPQRMERLWIACRAKAARTEADLRSRELLEFRDGQTRFGFSEPMPKALFAVLGEAYPGALRYSQLRERICRKLALAVTELKLAEEARLIQQLVSSFANGIVELHVQPFETSQVISARPRANALVRLQAEMGIPIVTAQLTNLRLPEGILRTLVPLLDGTRDFEGLLIELCAQAGATTPNGITAENLRRALQFLAARAALTDQLASGAPALSGAGARS